VVKSKNYAVGTNLHEQYVGGHMWFKNGKPTGGHNFVSGAFEGSAALREQATKDLQRVFGGYGVEGKIQTR
jgi:hypothetical protein